MEHVIVAFEGEKTAARIRDILEGAGIASCRVVRTADEVRRQMARQRITTVICGYKLREETAQDLFYDLPSATVMLVVARQNLLDLLDDDIFTLPAPVSSGDLCASVSLALQAARRLQRALRPQRSGSEAELVERAKAQLMAREGMSEEEAHRYLQKKSMDEGTKMAQTAQAVLEGATSPHRT